MPNVFIIGAAGSVSASVRTQNFRPSRSIGTSQPETRSSLSSRLAMMKTVPEVTFLKDSARAPKISHFATVARRYDSAGRSRILPRQSPRGLLSVRNQRRHEKTAPGWRALSRSTRRSCLFDEPSAARSGHVGQASDELILQVRERSERASSVVSHELASIFSIATA